MNYLRIRQPRSYQKETFDADSNLWSESDPEKVEVSRYSGDSDPDRGSVMRVVAAKSGFTLGSGYTLGDAVSLGGTKQLVGSEGVYKVHSDQSVGKYTVGWLYKAQSGSFLFRIRDEVNGITYASGSLNSLEWAWVEKEIEITQEADIKSDITVRFYSGENYLIDDYYFIRNMILRDPDEYLRTPHKVGRFQNTLSGRRVRDTISSHYEFMLAWNRASAEEYDQLREVYGINETLYFNDGDVSDLEETQKVYINKTYDLSDGTAYVSSGSSEPVAGSDCETYEYSGTMYSYVSVDDDNGYNYSGASDGEYIFHKFIFKTDYAQDEARRLRLKIRASGSDSSLQSIDGFKVKLWNGSEWQEVASVTSSDIRYAVYITSVKEDVESYIDSSTGEVKAIVQTRTSRNGSDDLSLDVYYVELEINDGLGSIVNLTHKIKYDVSGDGYSKSYLYLNSVYNKTQEKALYSGDYTVDYLRKDIAIKEETYGYVRYVTGTDWGAYYTDTAYDIGSDDFSFSIFVRLEDIGTSEYVICGDYKEATNDGWKMYLEDRKYKVAFGDGSDVLVVSTDGAYTENGWYHMAVVMSHNETEITDVTLYVDGEEVNSSVESGAMADIGSISANSSISFGRQTDRDGIGTKYLTGYIMWARMEIGSAWTASEVAEQAVTYGLSSSRNGRCGDISHEWGFNDASDVTVIYDKIGSVNLNMVGSATASYGVHSRTYAAKSGDEIIVDYSRDWEVEITEMPERWLGGDPGLSRSRALSIKLSTLGRS